MTNHAARPGWYPDPTGTNESRYFDDRWTDFVSNQGIQSVSPMPSSPQAAIAAAGPISPIGSQHSYTPGMPRPARRNNTKAVWIIVAGAATAGLAVIAVSAASASSGGSSSSGGGSVSSFCRDFAKSWSPIVTGQLTVSVFVQTIDSDPTTFKGGDARETNSVTVASQDAGVLAADTPSSLKDPVTGDSVRTELAGLHTFLLAGVKMAHNDASAAASVQSFDDTFMGSVAGVAAASCPQH
jgi:hypothetical protein